MANNPFDPQLVQIRKTLSRGGLATVNRGFGSMKTAPARTRQAPSPEPAEWWPENLSELNDVDVTSDPPTYGQTLVWNGTMWVPGDSGGGGGGSDRRTVPGPFDTVYDEFDDEAIDPAWVRVDGVGAIPSSVNWVESMGQLSMIHAAVADTANYMHAILRPIGTPMAVGQSFYTAFTMYANTSSPYVMGGLIIANGTQHGTGVQLLNLNYSGSNVLNTDMRVFANFQSQSTTTTGFTIPGLGTLTYTRLVYVATNTWRIDWSPNGIGWIIGATITSTIVPTHIGFLSSNWGNALPGVVAYEFLRRTAAPAAPPALPATITRTWSSDGLNGIFAAIAWNTGSFVNPSTLFTMSQSSNLDGTRIAARATDGVAGDEIHTTNSSGGTGGGSGQWWKVDFGATRRMSVTRFGIQGRAVASHEARNFQLEGSMDNSAWTTISANSGSTALPGLFTWYSAASTDATPWRYIRIRQTGLNASSDNYLTFGEIEFWGTLSTVP